MRKRCYMAGANTSEGFISYFDYVLRDAKRVYIIKGGPGCGKSTFIKRIGEDMLRESCDVDFIFCSADAGSLDAIIIQDIGVVIVDGTAPHTIDPKYPGAVERILDFGEYWDIDYLREKTIEIKRYIDEIGDEYKKLYGYLKTAKLLHDKLEREYLIGMNFGRAEEISDELIKQIITNRLEKKGKEWHRFSGGFTPQGNINFYDNLTDNIKNRYIVKGRPGTGKSTMNKRIAKAAHEAGYDVEYYHCAFDPESIDLIIIPELEFAMLDGTAPHVFHGEAGDNVIDMFNCIDKDIVKEDKEPIKSIALEYNEEVAKAREVFKHIKELNDALEEFYISATDFNNVNALRIRITKTLKEMIKEERKKKEI